MRRLYARQPSEPVDPPVGLVWIDTASGAKRRRGVEGWEPFVDKRRWSAEELQIIADLYPCGGAAAVRALLPHRSRQAIGLRALREGIGAPLRSSAHRKVLTDGEVARGLALYEGGMPMDVVARQLGRARSTVQNAVMIALSRQRGYRPAERDEYGHLTPAGIERLRELLRKGLRGHEIQLRLGISAGLVSHERRRYAADLKARGKRPLPPPGNGERYSGAKIPRETTRRVEGLLLEGYGCIRVAEMTGVSKTHCQRHKVKLVRRLRRRGEALPGCDLEGKRLRVRDAVGAILPSQIATLREHLLARMPVQRAAKLAGIGGSSAYRLRDELRAELAAAGQELHDPIRDSGRAATIASREASWLPPQKRYYTRLRTLILEHGDAEGARLMRAELAAETRREPKMQLTFEEQLALVASGRARVVANLPLRRPDPSMTLGGVATAAI